MSNVSAKTKTDWKRLESLTDDEIDTSDIPELGEEFFARAELRQVVKQPVTLRLDADVLEWFKGQGQGYQTRINKLLRLYMESQRHP
ncbi:MAG: BrnA antitoxin family protein [Pseudomonas sp.]